MSHNKDDEKVFVHMLIISLAEEFAKQKAILESLTSSSFAFLDYITETICPTDNKIVPFNSTPNAYNTVISAMVLTQLHRQSVTFSVNKSVVDIPFEMLKMIASYLPFSDALRFRQVSVSFALIVHNDFKKNWLKIIFFDAGTNEVPGTVLKLVPKLLVWLMYDLNNTVTARSFVREQYLQFIKTENETATSTSDQNAQNVNKSIECLRNVLMWNYGYLFNKIIVHSLNTSRIAYCIPMQAVDKISTFKNHCAGQLFSLLSQPVNITKDNAAEKITQSVFGYVDVIVCPPFRQNAITNFMELHPYAMNLSQIYGYRLEDLLCALFVYTFASQYHVCDYYNDYAKDYLIDSQRNIYGVKIFQYITQDERVELSQKVKHWESKYNILKTLGARITYRVLSDKLQHASEFYSAVQDKKFKDYKEL